jgi:hypothetical protein
LQNNNSRDAIITGFSTHLPLNEIPSPVVPEGYDEAAASIDSFLYLYEAETSGGGFLDSNPYIAEGFEPPALYPVASYNETHCEQLGDSGLYSCDIGKFLHSVYHKILRSARIG